MSNDIKENQILKYTLYLCKNHSIGEALREDINICLNSLKGVTLKKCSVSDFVGIKNNGAYREYKETLNAAKKVISRYALSYQESKEEGSDMETKLIDHTVQPFFIDMNLLFEYYCRALFKDAIDQNGDLANEIELESFEKEKRDLFDCTKQISNYYMNSYKPDIVIVKKNEPKEKEKNKRKLNKDASIHKKEVVAVIDAKCSDVENTKSQKRDRTHQVLSYMNALGCNIGGLISPNSDIQNNKNDCYVMDTLWQNDDFFIDSDKKLVYIPLFFSNKNENSLVKQDYEETVRLFCEELLNQL